MSRDVIPDDELAAAFRNTNFGNADPRKILEASVLKKALGYHCGHTITQIMKRLRLIGKSDALLVRGRDVLRSAYDHLMKDGG